MKRIERKYSEITYQELEEIRINSSIRFREGTDTDGSFFKLHAIDEGQVIFNGWTKQLPIDASEKSWETHSSNVTSARKCINFEKQEFTRNTDVFDEDRKKRQNNESYSTAKVKSIIPRATVERIRLTEWINMFLEKEVPNRKVTKT